LNSYSYGNAYRDLYFDSTGSRIIAAGCSVSTVDTFDLDLNLNNSVSFPGICPHGVTVYNSKICVALYNNDNVAVISNGTIENIYPTVCLAPFYSISVYSFGYFALSCYRNSQVYLYDSNMQYTSKSIGLGENVNDPRLDTNNRLAICGGKNVTIYN